MQEGPNQGNDDPLDSVETDRMSVFQPATSRYLHRHVCAKKVPSVQLSSCASYIVGGQRI
ncbi:hypothetical protein K443DRAFT_324287 [Laccaria amethystina LaAM-08-1]|uniref:Unplaced genomic scaffold K443scaffold_218, whole genome shotgun sequence n=1 Tax=Laccaria amethystina LaAM-08-1 TaxID=1095629 RepID=A0A0C9WTX8_9AGAR|nr:hypothetical protein K443DRAFT_324287 [Laccaria amethystina LaAM-08-1]